MNDSHVSGRYARALQILTVKLAAKDGVPLIGLLERTLEDLKGFAGVVGPGSRVGDFLAHPKVSTEDKRRVLRAGLAGRATPGVVVLADLLLRKKRLAVIVQIAHDFEVLVEQAKGLVHAQVVSAVPLTRAEHDRLFAQLERTTGRKILLSSAIDTSLVGGAYVRIGDRIVDRSVRTLLEAVAHQLNEVSV